jgi:hypothetical protein
LFQLPVFIILLPISGVTMPSIEAYYNMRPKVFCNHLQPARVYFGEYRWILVENEVWQLVNIKKLCKNADQLADD